MISCIEWVPKGAADPSPKKYEMSPAELDLLEKQAELEAALDNDDEDDDEDEDDEDEEVEQGESSKIVLPKIDPKSLPPEFRMDDYSSDEDDDAAAQGSALGNMLVGRESEMVGTHIGDDGMPADDDIDEDDDEEDDDDDANDEEKTDKAVGDSDDDSSADESDDDLADVPDTREYMPVDVDGLEAMGLSHVGNNGAMFLDAMDDDDADDDSDADDIHLSPDDAILVVAKTEEDFASLEVHVYEPKTGTLFVHHDIPLPSYPLCLAHGDINSDGGAGNYCAVGTFSPGIEVWNLDVLNPLEPSCILGGEDTTAADELMKRNMARAASGKKLKKKKIQGAGLRPGSHTDAVMALSWNKVHRQVIASGSADNTVKIWDITKAGEANGKCNAATFTHHRDKVQSVQWHPTEGTLLATGSYDKTIALVDARSGDQNCKRVKIPADCESISWDPFNQQYLTVATEDGTITCWDVRKFDSSSPLWSFVANEFGGVSDLTYNAQVPGMFATCSVDKTVTLWDAYNASGELSATPPQPCGNKDMCVGKLYTISFYPSSPWLLGCGGGGNELALWDLSSETAVHNRFGGRCKTEDIVAAEEVTGGESKTEDFEAMMAAGDAVAEKVRENASNSKKGKGKKKVHRRGR